MSYRDLRNFSEAMRELGFPKPISLESFRIPNWDLVEECLRWLCGRVEPDVTLTGGSGDREQRVALVTHATALLHSRANLKINGKKVYGADGWAVRELLKVASLLRAALHAPPPHAQGNEAEGGALTYDVTNRLSEIKQARALATDITAQGAFLYDLLAKEPENKEHRERALSRPLDMAAMEAALRSALEVVATRAAAARERIDSVAASEAALDAKLERRRAELARAHKRLHTVQKIKPAYQGELTALESEIESLWEQYVLRFRCVEALKHQLSTLETKQAEAAEEQQAAIMQLIHKYETEDVLGKLSDSEESDSSSDDGEASDMRTRPVTRPKTRLRVKTAAGNAEGRRAFGSMAVGGSGSREAIDDIRDEDDDTDTEFSDRQLYGGSSGSTSAARWSRRARPATRTLTSHEDEFADLIEEGGSGGSGASLGSSSESELRLERPSAPAPRHHPTNNTSDNEF